MNAAIDFRAHMATARQLYGRAPAEIVDDLRVGAKALLDLIESFGESPKSTDIATADASLEGIRRLLGQIRIATTTTQGSALWNP